MTWAITLQVFPRAGDQLSYDGLGRSIKDARRSAIEQYFNDTKSENSEPESESDEESDYVAPERPHLWYISEYENRAGQNRGAIETTGVRRLLEWLNSLDKDAIDELDSVNRETGCAAVHISIKMPYDLFEEHVKE